MRGDDFDLAVSLDYCRRGSGRGLLDECEHPRAFTCHQHRAELTARGADVAALEAKIAAAKEKVAALSEADLLALFLNARPGLQTLAMVEMGRRRGRGD